MNSKKLASSKYPTGIGFGGDNYEGFRLWLDADILEKSQSCDSDRTFETGPITDSATQYLKIVKIEVYGFPDNDTAKLQAKFRLEEEEQAYTNRKVNRKEFLSGGGTNEILFERQYKFKEQLNIDLDHERQQQGL